MSFSVKMIIFAFLFGPYFGDKLTITETEMTYQDFGRMLLSDKSDLEKG